MLGFKKLFCHCPAEDNNLDGFAEDHKVIVRSTNSGVWYGTLWRKYGNEVVLTNARRMWQWCCKESISLSGAVVYGINQEKSKIAPPVSQVWLEAVEIMPICGEPARSIEHAPIVQAEPYE